MGRLVSVVCALALSEAFCFCCLNLEARFDPSAKLAAWCTPLSCWGLDVMSESHCTNPNGGLLIRPKHKKICMSTFESHTIRIGRKASLKGIEFMIPVWFFYHFQR